MLSAQIPGLVFGVFAGGITTAASAAIVLVLWVGGNEVIDGKMTSGSTPINMHALCCAYIALLLGTLTSFILYTLTVATALGGLSSLYGDFMKAIG